MDLYVYNLDEYTTDSRQTTMIINLLMGDKKAKEDGERYILFVRDFFKEEEIPFTAVSHSEIPNVNDFNSTQATVVIFEDLMDAPKKNQDLITGFFTHGRHKNISCIYVAQRFFTIPKTIRENVNYISLHGGHGSLTDTKRIIRQYTEESESLAPVIDDLTLQREFIVFDLRRSKSDPLSIRFELTVAEAKKSSQLIEFAREYPSPKERKHLLVSGIIAKNADTWIKYVFREAYGLSGKTLGSDFQKFLAKVRDRTAKTEIPKSETVKELFSRYEVLKVIWTVEHYE
ncbi:hypothetical protein RIR_jg345.t2 [Rhizophagus irregularis DAOM 181602=DAOM 197198]|nr:hypothetical protein RIR_jg345.t2 [Rhizophagus irregularis DAOM 181602=DAOM 197198]